jgi:hypothetical protein
MDHRARRRIVIGLLLAAATILLSGCGQPLVEAGQPAADAKVLPLSSSSSLGQSFMAYQGGLEGIEFRMAPLSSRPSGRVTYELLRSPGAAEKLASGIVDIGAGVGDVLRIDFPPQSVNRLQDFYVELKYAGPDGNGLLAGPAGSYPNGAAYVNGQPQEAQLSFRLFHDPVRAAIGLAELIAQWLFFGGIASVALILPGLALLLALPVSIRGEASRLDLIFLAPALSVAVYPLLIVFAGFAGAKAGPAYAWVPVLAGGIAIGVRLVRRRGSFGAVWAVRPRITREHLALALVIGLIVFSRLWVIRALEAPMWRDSYQHSVLTQLLIERGGLFDDWKPYAEMTSLTYHIGFHSVSAVFGWLTGLPGGQAVMWMGQFLNVAAVLALYPLARRMTRAPWAGVIAVGFAGLISMHPAFYVNWGRYTQLAGQVALPGVMWLVWTTIAKARESGRSGVPLALIGISGIAWAGLALTHYRILILGVLFALAVFPTGLIMMKSRRWGLGALLAGAALGSLLFAPWFARTLVGAITTTGAELMSTPAGQVSDYVAGYNGSPAPLATYPQWLILVVPVMFAICLWKRNVYAISLFAWWVVITLATNPGMLGLPGAGIITNFALSIFGYLPLALLAASVIPSGAALSRPTFVGVSPGITSTAAFVVVMVAAFLGFRERITDVRPEQYSIVLRPDVRAAEWIRAHTSPGATFLVSSYQVYDGSLISGSDGGWWLPLLTKRSTTQPPLNYSMERPPAAGYVDRVRELPVLARQEGLTSSVTQRLRDTGITHVYVGQSHAGGDYMLVPSQLDLNPALTLVYRRDRVSIYQLIP